MGTVVVTVVVVVVARCLSDRTAHLTAKYSVYRQNQDQVGQEV